MLDAPTASPFTLESVGGSYGEYEPDSEDTAAQAAAGGAGSDSDESVMERGDAVRLKHRPSSNGMRAAGLAGDGGQDDGSAEGGAARDGDGPQHRRGHK